MGEARLIAVRESIDRSTPDSLSFAIMCRLFCLALCFALPISETFADWPTARGDAARSGRTSGTLPDDPAPVWVHRPEHAPKPAWPREERMIFDRAFVVTAARDRVFFGSSAEGTVTALDAASGEVKWTFFTDAPVRFAPTVWEDRVFVVSDDGWLRALAIADGSLLRKWRGGPEDDLVLGNGRIVSRYPARGAPVIYDGMLYYAAGIWQSEGIHVHAIDLTTGEVKWTNDTAGSLDMPQPHGGADAASGVTVQGDLVATKEQLFVPTGRAVPAAFNRRNGEFQYYHLQKFGKQGGSEAMAVAGELFNPGTDYKGTVFDGASGESIDRLPAGAFAALAEGVLHADGKIVQFFRRTPGKGIDRLGKEIETVTYQSEWKTGDVPGGRALIVAGETAITGGDGFLAAVDLKTRTRLWTREINGRVHSLAVAQGRLYASLEDGAIHCFAAAGSETRETGPVKGDPPATSPAVDALAEEIVKRSGITEGYCLDLGCGDGSLAIALARRSKLHLVAMDPDPARVAQLRRDLVAAGLHGARVTVLQGDPAKTRLPKQMFNLIVSGRAASGESLDAATVTEVARLQRPWGGVTCLGPAEKLEVSVRGALPGAGDWTHQYTDPANTGSSADPIRGPLRVHWYDDVAIEIPQRHGRAPAPLFSEGRLFVMGMDEMLAADAYNGRVLWRFAVPGALHAYDADHLMGTAGTGSNFCVQGDSVYLRHKGKAIRLDAATGKVLREFLPPPLADGRPATWGFIACRDGILFGSAANEEHVVVHGWRPADMSSQFTESKALFAYEVASGNLLWRYDAKESIRHNAIAIAEGRVFFIDRALATGDLLDEAEARRGDKTKTYAHPGGTLIRLDSRSGEIEWSHDEDVWGTLLAYSEAEDLLLMAYQSTRFKLPSEEGGKLAVFHGADGYRIWEKSATYKTRPLIRDQSILAEGGSWDLSSGEESTFNLGRSYGCGQLASSKHLLLFRSATFAYLDSSAADSKLQNIGGVRPGCWINALPVGGLVLLPDASAGCSCSYQNRSWMALQGSE